MRIAVPGRTSFSKFVKVDSDEEGNPKYSGFCIEIFEKVLTILGYDLPYDYYPINATYNDLVQLVYNKVITCSFYFGFFLNLIDVLYTSIVIKHENIEYHMSRYSISSTFMSCYVYLNCFLSNFEF